MAICPIPRGLRPRNVRRPPSIRINRIFHRNCTFYDTLPPPTPNNGQVSGLSLIGLVMNKQISKLAVLTLGVAVLMPVSGYSAGLTIGGGVGVGNGSLTCQDKIDSAVEAAVAAEQAICADQKDALTLACVEQNSTNLNQLFACNETLAEAKLSLDSCATAKGSSDTELIIANSRIASALKFLKGKFSKAKFIKARKALKQ